MLAQIVILEAMKLEISVRISDEAASACSEGQTVTIDKLLVKPGDTVSSGEKLALLRKKWLA